MTLSTLLALTVCFSLLSFYLNNKKLELKQIPIETKEEVIFNNSALKYVRVGNNMNCLQSPLSGPVFEQDRINISQGKAFRFAYVWYATHWEYLCSALTSLRMLKVLRNSSELQVDYVLTYVLVDLEESRCLAALERWEEEGGILKNFSSLHQYLEPGYFKGTLQKFHSFLLTDYTRVVVMDSDGIPLCDMDHLFLLKFPTGAKLAAPQGYWHRNFGVMSGYSGCKEKEITYVTTALMIIKPSMELYERAANQFGTLMIDNPGMGPQPHDTGGKVEKYDGDIINIEFGCNDEVLILPKVYGTLSPEYKIGDPLSKKFESCKDLSQVCYIHFSGGPKPWSAREFDGMVSTIFDAKMAETMNKWFKNAHNVCYDFVK